MYGLNFFELLEDYWYVSFKIGCCLNIDNWSLPHLLYLSALLTFTCEIVSAQAEILNIHAQMCIADKVQIRDLRHVFTSAAWLHKPRLFDVTSSGWYVV